MNLYEQIIGKTSKNKATAVQPLPNGSFIFL